MAEYWQPKDTGYGSIITSLKCYTRESAISSFNYELERVFLFIRGYKYWRRIPELVTLKDWEHGNIEYTARARIVSFLNKVPKLETINETKFPLKLEDFLIRD